MARFQAAIMLAFMAKQLLIIAIRLAGRGRFRFEMERGFRFGPKETGKGNGVDIYA